MSKPHAKDQMMQAHIIQWQSSGLTQTNYCKDAGIKLDDFHYYKKKFTQRKSPINQRHQLIPVKILEELPVHNNESIHLCHRNGFNLEINLSDDLSQLKPLLSLLSSVQ